MHAAATLALVAAGVSLYAAVLAARFSRAPGWSEQKWFGLFAAAAAAYAAGDLVTFMPVSDRVVTAATRLQAALATIQAAIWVCYSDVQLRLEPRPLRRRVATGLVVAGLLALVPGVAFTDHVVTVAVGAVGYRIPTLTRFGDLMVLAILLVVTAVAVRFAVAARRGVPHAGLHAVGLAALAAAGVNDGLVVAGLARTPLLAELGIIAAIAAVGLALAARFVDEARLLHRLRERLEEAVAERSGALAAREAELTRAGHLAALGQLAAGVAHEIAGPAAAAASNVRQLARDMRRGELPEDAVGCLEESEEALARITRTLRMLHDAERVALSPGGSRVVSLVKAVEEAVEAARIHRSGAEVATEVPDGLGVKGEWRVVTEVLTLVLSQIREEVGGKAPRLTVRAGPAGERVRVEVERAAAPGAAGPAAGGAGEVEQGLAVARGLAASLGGTLTAVGGAGGLLRVVLELPAGYT